MSVASEPPIVQRKMVVGRVDDPAEHEADRIADAVMRAMAAPSLVAPSDNSERVRRSASAGSGGDAIDAGTQAAIERARGGGQALDDSVRAPLESAFGSDLSAVRVHTGTKAAQLSSQLSARAFTTGADVFFGAGEYRPGTGSGDRLLAHELAHTVQQGAAAPIRRELTLQNTKWSDAKSMSVTTSSAVGVFFLKDKAGKTLVVKGAHGTARLEMASEIMEAAGGEAVPQRMIGLKSKEGKKLLSVMKSLAKKAPIDQASGKNEVLDKFNAQLAGGQFDAVQVMTAYQNLGNMQELAVNADMSRLVPMMLKNGFFRQFGRMHAADVFMGNEDRLSKGTGGLTDVALKNIFVNTKTGQAVGLDMELNAHNFAQVTGDIYVSGPQGASSAPSLQGSESLDFVNFSIYGSGAKKDWAKKTATVNGKMGMRGGEQFVPDQNEALDPTRAGKLFDRFVDNLADEARVQNNAAAAAYLKAYDWTVPRQQFLAGVDQGLQNLMSKASGLAASADAKQGEALFDPNVFRVRSMYAKLKQLGYQDEQEIIDVLVRYVDHLRQGGTEPQFLQMLQAGFLKSVGTGQRAPTPVLPSLPSRPSPPSRPSTAAPTSSRARRGSLTSV